MQLLESAIQLANRGFYVFPLQAGSKFPPKLKDFANEATRDIEKIKSWWIRWPFANVGIYTGKYFNLKTEKEEALLAADIDTKNGKMGEIELVKLELQGFEFPSTCEQRTATGGRHLVYSTPVGVTGGESRLGHGIDVCSYGRYIVGAGSSVGKSFYTIDHREPSEAPQWMVKKCGEPTIRERKELDPSRINQEHAINRTIFYLTNEAPVAISGDGGNQTTFVVAAKCKNLGVDEIKCIQLMHDHWNSRCEPPWASEDLVKIVENAYDYSQSGIGSAAPDLDFDKVKEEPKRRVGLFRKKFSTVKANLNQQYLIKDILIPQSMSVIYGEAGGGKTFLTLDLSLHLALGREWMGKKVKQGGVVYIASEGGMGIENRIEAFKKYHKLTNEEVPFSVVPCPIDLLNPKASAEEIVKLIEEIQKEDGYKVELIVIDTLSRAFAGGDENSSKDMGAFVKNIDRIRDAIKAHVLVIHHSGKNKASGARGHSSLRAATDTEIEVDNHVATIKKQRELESTDPIGFQIKQVELGNNLDNETIYSCVVLPSNTTATRDFSKKPLEIGSIAYKGLKAIEAAIEWQDIQHDGHTCCDMDQWKKSFLELAYPTGIHKKTVTDRAFLRAAEALLGTYVNRDDKYAWLM